MKHHACVIHASCEIRSHDLNLFFLTFVRFEYEFCLIKSLIILPIEFLFQWPFVDMDFEIHRSVYIDTDSAD